MYTVHTFVYSNIFEAILMNYYVYSKIEELLFDFKAIVCMCMYVWVLLTFLKCLCPVMRFDIKLQQLMLVL